MSTDALRYDKVQFAHTLRGVAALVVAFGAHLGGLFWQNRPVACDLVELPSNRMGKRIARSLGGKIDGRAQNRGLTEIAAAPDAKA